jgi:hypothetical protein
MNDARQIMQGIDSLDGHISFQMVATISFINVN